MLRALPPKQEQPEKSTGGALWEKLDPETKSTQSNDQYPEHGDLKHEDLKLSFAVFRVIGTQSSSIYTLI